MYEQTGNTIVTLEDISCLSRKENSLCITLRNGNTVKEVFEDLLTAIKEFNRIGALLLPSLAGKQDNLEE